MEPLVIPFEQLRMTDVEQVGGKNSSLGEMISQLAGSGVRVPGGFATTAQAYRDFLAQSGLDAKINAMLDALDVDDGCEALGVGGPVAASERVHGVDAWSDHDCQLKVFGPTPAIPTAALTEHVMGIPGGHPHVRHDHGVSGL